MQGSNSGAELSEQLSKQILLELLEATSDLVGVADAEGKALYFNAGGRALLGLPEDTPSDTYRLSDFHDAETLAHLREVAFPRAREEGAWTGELELRSPVTGERLHVSAVIVAHRDGAGRVARYSTLQRLNRAARAQEAKLKRQRLALVELASNPVLVGETLAETLEPILRAASICLEVSNVSAWFLSEDQERLECLACYEASGSLESHRERGALTCAEFPAYMEALERERTITAHDARDHPATRAFEETYLERYGVSSLLDAPIRRHGVLVGVVCHEHTGPARRWSGDEESFAGSIGDLVTLAVASQEERGLEASRRELEAGVLRAQRLEALGVLAGGVAHDFNNLLQGMFGHLELAQRSVDASRPDLTREALSDLRHVTRQGAELCRQLLAYANHRRDALAAPVVDVIEDMRTLLEVCVRGRGQLCFDLDPGCHEAALDPAQLRQIVLNLVTNAAEAALKPQGRIQVRAARIDVDAAELAGYELGAGLSPGRYVWLEVSDEGQGVAKEERERIFAPFYSTRGQDRGLGLASVLGILKALGGAIRLESEPGQGAAFSVLLPALRRGESDTFSRTHVSAPSAGQRVLVVEDQVAVRRAASQVLEYVGFEVLAVGDAEEALALYAEERESLYCVLVDVGLPRMNGIELVERLQALYQVAPAILVTGYGDQGVEEAAARLGTPLLHKPYTIDDLQAALSEFRAGSGPKPRP